jgi:hypothetical protein
MAATAGAALAVNVFTSRLAPWKRGDASMSISLRRGFFPFSMECRQLSAAGLRRLTRENHSVRVQMMGMEFPETAE